MATQLNRTVRYALAATALCASARALPAQDSVVPPRVVGQLADAVLSGLLPPRQRLSRIPVAKRTIFFDHRRTMSAFGHTNPSSVELADLGLRARVAPGNESLFDDCPHDFGPVCERLGWGVYVWLRPVTVGTSQAVIRATVLWVDRGSEVVTEGVAPRRPGLRVGYSSEVHLARSSDGRWKFVREGATRAF